MKIGGLARRTGVSASALRYYERCGLLVTAYRMGDQRTYSEDIIFRVLLIRFASEMGFTLSEVKVFLDGLRNNAPVGARWRKLARQKINDVDSIIERSNRLKSLLEHLLECRCASLRICVECLRLSPVLPQIAASSKRNQAQGARSNTPK